MRGHFLLKSKVGGVKRHSSVYCNIRKLPENNLRILGTEMVSKAGLSGRRIVTVPASVGNKTLAAIVAKAVVARTTAEDVITVIVADVITTEQSVVEALTFLSAPATVILCVLDRRENGEELIQKIPVVSLVKEFFPIYNEGDCPLCKRGEFLIDPLAQEGFR